ncbi:MAG: thiamine pyrophosphate-requiring protein [Mycobacterium pseudokansasii]|uniref:Thiamine pyrophosphate-containing protein YdaP n=1 Tax=Mycobacterium pseudokansasii TaxID=2341080 RepID=A0A498QSX8_9MYCO|nr:thiamine pyrophosphate-requiring protein [Mycobacterium pseudokansasii]KZS69440.1 thiamine pyrophosphate-binding protein [Mycobacterium kansasii]MBY0388114.1 thiamine pyrophosphate-requiring protein [Mycobacterium pseudokansasii]VAZ96114.1 Putative thiamine pyrophosphate-containing protein YdaP [Mycobacterium pseudokansasii]VAZ97449.1 Putative thiamine pyrophosphate-containing protein YdaP [Mycobacterium pseudokansasii]VBA51532.1 Putative thiamine pyrophosphate-containing protein YdaP [Myco
MAATEVSDFLLERLRDWGVEHVFAYPGDGINGLLAAWGRAGNKPMFVQARHEEMAAFEAVGYAKFSNRLGVCAATSGPGAIHLLNGLYDAKLDRVPVVAIVGQTNRSAMGGSYQQEVDLLSLYKDVASDYVQMVTVPEQLPNVLDRAIRTALTRRAPTALIIPSDVQELKYSPPAHEFKMVPSSLGFQRPGVEPARDGLQRAADVLNAGERVAMLIGCGARNAAREIVALADVLGAGVAKALLGKDVLSDELPFVTGAIGLLGTRPSYEMMRDCDTLLTIGSSFPYTQFLPPFGGARGVQIDIDPTVIGMRYPNEVNLVGDAAATVRALLPLLQRKSDRSWRETIERNVARWWETMAMEAQVAAKPINPMRLFADLSPKLPDNAIITADSGSSANWYARQLKFRDGIRGSLSGNLATMGPGVPYGIGGKFAHPDRPVIVFAGDGAMQMNGMAELITIAHYWKQWADPRLVVAVLHNNDLNQVTWEMRAMAGAPKFAESQTLPDVDYAGFAASLGLGSATLTAPDQIASAWDQALQADRPTVLDVHCDADIPPVPPHATFDQMKSAASAVLRGDENAFGIIKEGVKIKAQEFLPHRETSRR